MSYSTTRSGFVSLPLARGFDPVLCEVEWSEYTGLGTGDDPDELVIQRWRLAPSVGSEDARGFVVGHWHLPSCMPPCAHEAVLDKLQRGVLE